MWKLHLGLFLLCIVVENAVSNPAVFRFEQRNSVVKDKSEASESERKQERELQCGYPVGNSHLIHCIALCVVSYCMFRAVHTVGNPVIIVIRKITLYKHSAIQCSY